MFTGFPEETIRFFLNLRFHNDIQYFKQYEEDYDAFIKQPFFAFIDELAPTALKVSGDMEVRPYKCLARIRRDTRFTKDKSPFRDHLWLLFRRAGEPRENSVMYWFELSPEHVNWGLGFWSASRPVMDAFRQRLLRKPDDVIHALHTSHIPSQTLFISGDHYQRMSIPTEVPSKLRPLYSLKEFYVERKGVSQALVYSPEIAEVFADDMLKMKPLYQLLRSVADEGLATRSG